MEPDDRAAIEEALTYPEESAGRLMQRDLIAVPEHWTVGQVIDYLRSSDELATDFWEVFVVIPSHHPVGTCKLSTILRSPRRSGRRRDAARADADPGRHGPGRSRAAVPEIRADLGRGGRWRRPAGRHDHGRRHRPHHPGRSRRGRAAAVRRGRRRHQRADRRDRTQPPDLAGRQPRHRDPRGQRGRAVPRARSRGSRCSPC